jgi:hypothetical protein
MEPLTLSQVSELELLTLEEVEILMLRLRQRWSALCKLELVRQQEWLAQHPRIADLQDRLWSLQDELAKSRPDYDYDIPLDAREEKLQREIWRICDELAAEPKFSGGLTESESNELRAVMSQFQKLRHALKRHQAVRVTRQSHAV